MNRDRSRITNEAFARAGEARCRSEREYDSRASEREIEARVQKNTYEAKKASMIRSDREELLMRLSEVEFAALDLNLYLNTHPCDTEAIEKYNLFCMEARRIREEYEHNFGALFSYYTPSGEDYFGWISDPWVWDRDFLPMAEARR